MTFIKCIHYSPSLYQCTQQCFLSLVLSFQLLVYIQNGTASILTSGGEVWWAAGSPW